MWVTVVFILQLCMQLGVTQSGTTGWTFTESQGITANPENIGIGTELPDSVESGQEAILNHFGESCPAGHRCVVVLECMPCGYGFFKPDQSSSLCSQCPTGCTTLRKGATNWRECIAKCPHGYQESDDGKTCIKCPPGFYKESWGNIPCTQCPNNDYDDSMVGLTSVSDCYSSWITNPPATAYPSDDPNDPAATTNPPATGYPTNGSGNTMTPIPPSTGYPTDDSGNTMTPIPPATGYPTDGSGNTWTTNSPVTGYPGDGSDNTMTPIPPATGYPSDGSDSTWTTNSPATGYTSDGSGNTVTPIPPATGYTSDASGNTVTSIPPATGYTSDGSGNTVTPIPPATGYTSDGPGSAAATTNPPATAHPPTSDQTTDSTYPTQPSPPTTVPGQYASRVLEGQLAFNATADFHEDLFNWYWNSDGTDSTYVDATFNWVFDTFSEYIPSYELRNVTFYHLEYPTVGVWFEVDVEMSAAILPKYLTQQLQYEVNAGTDFYSQVSSNMTVDAESVYFGYYYEPMNQVNTNECPSTSCSGVQYYAQTRCESLVFCQCEFTTWRLMNCAPGTYFSNAVGVCAQEDCPEEFQNVEILL